MTGFFDTSDSDTIKKNDYIVRLKGAIFGLIPVLIMAIVLLGASGDPFWLIVWLFVLIHVGATVFLALNIDVSPIIERMRSGDGCKKRDRNLVRLLNITGLFILLVAGLNHRYYWEDLIPVSLQFLGILIFIVGYLILIYAAITNSFFSSVVRIQRERCHQVISDGPYQRIRHPGYLGIIFCLIAEPLMFQCLMAGIPCIIAVGLMVKRTSYEDLTLIQELDGYSVYSRNVRYRLIPGLW